MRDKPPWLVERLLHSETYEGLSLQPVLTATEYESTYSCLTLYVIGSRPASSHCGPRRAVELSDASRRPTTSFSYPLHSIQLLILGFPTPSSQEHLVVTAKPVLDTIPVLSELSVLNQHQRRLYQYTSTSPIDPTLVRYIRATAE